jgi:hypothetical protein
MEQRNNSHHHGNVLRVFHTITRRNHGYQRSDIGYLDRHRVLPWSFLALSAISENHTEPAYLVSWLLAVTFMTLLKATVGDQCDDVRA